MPQKPISFVEPTPDASEEQSGPIFIAIGTMICLCHDGTYYETQKHSNPVLELYGKGHRQKLVYIINSLVQKGQKQCG